MALGRRRLVRAAAVAAVIAWAVWCFVLVGRLPPPSAHRLVEVAKRARGEVGRTRSDGGGDGAWVGRLITDGAEALGSAPTRDPAGELFRGRASGDVGGARREGARGGVRIGPIISLESDWRNTRGTAGGGGEQTPHLPAAGEASPAPLVGNQLSACEAAPPTPDWWARPDMYTDESLRCDLRDRIGALPRLDVRDIPASKLVFSDWSGGRHALRDEQAAAVEAIAARVYLLTLVGVDGPPLLPHFLRHYVGQRGVLPRNVLLTFNVRPRAPRRDHFAGLGDLDQEVLPSATVRQLMEVARALGGTQHIVDWLAEHKNIAVDAEQVTRLVEATSLVSDAGVIHAQWWVGAYTSCKRLDVHMQLLSTAGVTRRSQWVIEADVDEFVAHRRALLVLAQAEAANASWVPGRLYDRVSSDGSLVPLQAEPEITIQFPVECEITTGIAKATPSKVFAYTGDLRARTGHHHVATSEWFRAEMTAQERAATGELRSNGVNRRLESSKQRVCTHMVSEAALPRSEAEPVRYVREVLKLYHFKWDASLRERLNSWRETHKHAALAVEDEKTRVLRFLDRCDGVCLWCDELHCTHGGIQLPWWGMCAAP